MIIGVPKEIKNSENRVALTPAGAFDLVNSGHKVIVEKSAGAGISVTDDDYKAVGAEIADKKTVFDNAELIVKVKEPIKEEYSYYKKGQYLFTYLHAAADQDLGDFLLERQITSIAYETVTRTK